MESLSKLFDWLYARTSNYQLVLGQIGAIDAELRNRRRAAPLETVTVDLPGGRKLKLPTVAEMLRIEA